MNRAVAGFALAVGALAGFLYVFDPVGMWAVLQGVRPVPFAVGLLAVVLAIGCWGESMRRVLVAAGGSVQPHRGLAAYATGMFAKQLLPMGNAGGVPIMAYAIDREARIGFDRSLGVVTIADFLGLLSSLLLGVVGIGYVLLLFPGTRLVRAALVGVGIFAVAIVSAALLLLYRRDVLRHLVLGLAHLLRGTLGGLSRRIEARLTPERVSASLDRYFATVDSVRADRRSLLVAGALALAGWTLFAVPLYTSAMALGRPIPFGLVLFIVPAGGLATLVPLPGGLGGVEFAIAGMVVAMTGMDLALAGAIVLLYRVCVYWLPVFLGLLAIGYTGADIRSLEAREGTVPPLDPRG